MLESLRDWQDRATAFRQEASAILATHESSTKRLITLDDTRKKLTFLSLRQDELFREALSSVEHGIHRAAHVLAWAAFIDYLEEKLASDGLVRVFKERPDWAKYSDIETLREKACDYDLIEVAKKVGLLTQQVKKVLHGLLSKRNECAHPSSYKPGLNESLGYISELLSRIEKLAPRKL